MKDRSVCTNEHHTTDHLYLYLYLHLYVQCNAAAVTVEPLREKDVKGIFLTWLRDLLGGNLPDPPLVESDELPSELGSLGGLPPAITMTSAQPRKSEKSRSSHVV